MAKFSVMIEALVGGRGGHASRQAFEVEGKDENEARTAVLRYYEQTWHPKPGEVKVVKVVKVSNSFQNGRARAEAELAPKLARFGNTNEGDLPPYIRDHYRTVGASVTKVRKKDEHSLFVSGRNRNNRLFTSLWKDVDSSGKPYVPKGRWAIMYTD